MSAQLVSTMNHTPLATLPPPQHAMPTEPVRSSPPPLTTRVVGDDALSREGLAGYLRRCPGVDVLADGAVGRVDVVVVVADRADAGTVRAVRAAHGESPCSVVLVVSAPRHA